MAFELDFEVAQANCCDQMQVCDTTGDYDPSDPKKYCGGYARSDADPADLILRSSVASTLFNWVFPDGTTKVSTDIGLTIAQYAQVSFVLSLGAEGEGIVVSIDDIWLGSAIFLADLADTIESLVNSINLNSDVTGWWAYFSGTTITVVNKSSGIEFNGLTLAVDLTTAATLVVVIANDQTAGGNDGDDCKTIILPDLYGYTTCPPTYPCWPDGVYTLTYMIFDSNGVELARRQKKFYFDCAARKCIYAHIKQMSGDSCSCSDGTWAKVLNLKMLLEAAEMEFDEGLYECANEHIQDILEQCKTLCLDC